MFGAMSIASPATDAAPWPQDLLDLDNLIGLGEAAGLIRRWSGERTSPSTLFRWCRDGRLRVRLPHVRPGRHIRTTEAAVRWFIAETTRAEIAHHAGDDAPPSRRTPRPTPDALAAELRAEGL